MDFITSEMFLTFVGCIAIVAIVVQSLKNVPVLKNINAAWLDLIVSVVVGVIRIFFVGNFSAEGIVLGIINIFVIYLGAIGGYETVKQLYQKIKGEE